MMLCVVLCSQDEHMSTQRLNITLPKDVADRLRNKPNKSRFIAQALREKLDSDAGVGRIRELAEAYRQASSEERELADDWDSLAGDAI